MIGDIAEPAERGGFFGLYSLGPMVSSISHSHSRNDATTENARLGHVLVSSIPQCHDMILLQKLRIGPVVGGILADKLGWRLVPDFSRN